MMVGNQTLRLNLSPNRRGALKHMREVLLLVGAYFAYMFVKRFIMPGVEVEALANTIKVLALSMTASCHIELRCQVGIPNSLPSTQLVNRSTTEPLPDSPTI